MADIAAGDVTYAVVSRAIDDSGNKRNVLTVAFGNGTLTYPSGGIPLTKASFGCPNVIKSVDLFSPASANGFVYKYDMANNKIRIYQTAAVVDTDPAAALVELVATTDAPAAATLYCEVVGW